MMAVYRDFRKQLQKTVPKFQIGDKVKEQSKGGDSTGDQFMELSDPEDNFEQVDSLDDRDILPAISTGTILLSQFTL